MMTASELSRQLLFYGYDEATDFLKNSPLNRYLYKKFLLLLPEYGINVPMVTFFNEMYYQCVRVNYDGTPGVDIEKRYIAEEEERLKSQIATNIVFSVVWAVLKSKRDLTFHEDCFLSQLNFYIEDCGLKDVAKTLYTEIRYFDIEIPNSFPTLTCPIGEIPQFEVVKSRTRSLTDMINASVESKLGMGNQYFELNEHYEAWNTVTGNYSHSIIEKLVRLYTNPEEQLGVITRINISLPKGYEKTERFLRDLENRIKIGNFDHEDAISGRDMKDYHEPDEQQDFEYSRALSRASNEEERDIVDDLKQECDNLKARIDEIQKSHEMEQAKMEAQYKAEIEKIRKERIMLAHAPEVKPEPETKPKELTLTLTEIADHVKARFSKSGADEICTLLYGKAAEHGYLGEETFKLIDGIVPAVLKRDKPQQTIEIPKVQQVNINPQTVINKIQDQIEKEVEK